MIEAAIETVIRFDCRFGARFREMITANVVKSYVTKPGETEPGMGELLVFPVVFHMIICHKLPLTRYFGLMIILKKQKKQ